MITLRATLRSNDDIDTRAAHIVYLLGLDGDPEIIRTHRAVVADTLRAYAAADRDARGGG